MFRIQVQATMVWKSGQCAASLSASLNLSKASNTCVAMPWACHRARQSKCSGFQNVVRSGAKSELSADAATFSPPPPRAPRTRLKELCRRDHAKQARLDKSLWPAWQRTHRWLSILPAVLQDQIKLWACTDSKRSHGGRVSTKRLTRVFRFRD